MPVSARRLPKLLGVLTLAFAESEAHGLYSAIALLRGFAIQLGYRWGLGTVIADDKDQAVLLWSPVTRASADIRPLRTVAGVAIAVAIGVALFVTSNVILLLPLGILLRAFGASASTWADVRVAIVSMRLLITLVRAVHAYRHDARFLTGLPAATGRRWRLDFVAAVPAGQGLGSRVVQDFLRLADERDAEVTLNCESVLVPFYRRHGFRLVGSPVAGQEAMLRAPRSRRVSHDGAVDRGRLASAGGSPYA